MIYATYKTIYTSKTKKTYWNNKAMDICNNIYNRIYNVMLLPNTVLINILIN